MSIFFGNGLIPVETGRSIAFSPIISPLKLKVLHFAPYCSPNEYLPPPVEGFAYAKIDDRLYIFGGSDLNGQETGELYCFTLKSGWLKVESQGQIDNDKPTLRVAAAMTAYNQKLYLFGGINEKDGWLNDFYEFDTENLIWKRLLNDDQAQNIPTPRDKVALIALRDKIYLYGGFGPRKRNTTTTNGDQSGGGNSGDNGHSSVTPASDNDTEQNGDADKKSQNGDSNGARDEEKELKKAMETVQNQQVGAEFDYFNDFYCYDPSNNQWSPVEVDVSTGSPTSAGDEAKKALPPGLAAYTVGALADKLLYFGGKTSAGERTNSVYCFALGLKKWLPLNVRDDSRWPNGRSFHSSVVAKDRYLITFGGRDTDDWEKDDLWLLDTSTMQWMLVRCEGIGGINAPCGRYGHALTVLPDADSRQHLVIYGGSAELDPASGVAQDVLSDMYIVPVDELIQASAPVIGETEDEKEANHQHHLHHHRKSTEGTSGDEPTAAKVPRCDDCIDL